MKSRIACSLLLAAFFVNGSTGSAAVLEVPSSYPTISAAIAAANEGDTVRVAPGTYVENIDLSGKPITVTSHYAPGGDWRLVESTVIDGSSPTDQTAASTVTFRSGEDGGTVFQGFTVTGGKGTQWIDPSHPTYTWRGGGGIFCYQSSPTIRYAVIMANEVSNDGEVDGAQGGGMLTFRGNPLVHNTIIVGNAAEYGGGLVVDYSGATIRNTIISRNTGGRTYGGGGVWTIGDSDAPIVIENSAIVDNTSPTLGGALYVWSSTVEVRSSIVWGNHQALGGPVKTTGGGTVAMSYCNVEHGFEGLGNINSDPRFINPHRCFISPQSGCVDRGDPDAALADPEDPNRPGQAAWPARGGLRNDIGPYGGPGGRAMGPPPIVYNDSGASSPSPAEAA